MRAIDEQALLQRGGDQRRAINGKLDAEDQAFAADLADENRILRPVVSEAFAQFRAAITNIHEQFGVFDGLQELQRSGADQRAAAEGGAMQAAYGDTRAATASLARMAPSGRPAANGLATRTMSGLEENFW